MGFVSSPTEYRIDRWDLAPATDPSTELRAHVSGHPTGILAAFMGILGMSRRLDLRLTTDSISIETSSLSASGRTIAPLSALSSFTAVRTRSIFLPFAVGLLGIVGSLAGLTVQDPVALLLGLPLIALAIFLYRRGERLAVRLSVASGVRVGFVFKPGTAEGVVVDERAAYELADLATVLVLGHALRGGRGTPSAAPAHGAGAALRAPRATPLPGAAASGGVPVGGFAAVGVGPVPGVAASAVRGSFAPGSSPVDTTVVAPTAVPVAAAVSGGAGGSSSPTAGWYRDPRNANQERYWNGTGWTDAVRSEP